ncbi:hypothetical protein [Pseudanabaena sp. BC1403]|uniref:hypothetical protein n=1 Tax=Pseudanabaena sp. BC1403 TaxID=2043171 RepID=UPI0015E1927A|nr:hypothetical protein [Pseudanabaena sp. BC1403]
MNLGITVRASQPHDWAFLVTPSFGILPLIQRNIFTYSWTVRLHRRFPILSSL